jgi:hypothetical protein
VTAIKEAVLLRKMPPWFADTKVSHFSNDASLTQNDIDYIAPGLQADFVATSQNPAKDMTAVRKVFVIMAGKVYGHLSLPRLN